MKCVKCNAEMKNVDLHGFAGSFPYLAFKEKHLIGEEKRSGVDCLVCPDCGYIELRAKNPEAFKNC